MARDCTCARRRLVEVTDPSSLRVTFLRSGCHSRSHVHTASVPRVSPTQKGKSSMKSSSSRTCTFDTLIWMLSLIVAMS